MAVKVLNKDLELDTFPVAGFIDWMVDFAVVNFPLMKLRISTNKPLLLFILVSEEKSRSFPNPNINVIRSTHNRN